MKSIAQPKVHASIRARLERIKANTERKWGKMTPQQMLVHVSLGMERVVNGEQLPDLPKPPSRFIKFLALAAPLPWPKGIPTKLDPASTEVDAAAFDAERMRALAALDAMAGSDGSQFPDSHPAFGPVNARDWHRWAYLHVNHHLKQFGL